MAATVPEAGLSDLYRDKLAEAENLVAKRKNSGAYRLLRELTGEFPDGWEPYDHLALMEYEKGRVPAAEKYARQAVALNEDAPYATLVLGMLAQEKNLTSEAKVAYQRFLKLCPDCRYARDIANVLKGL